MLSANWKSGNNIEKTQIASQWKVVLHLRQTLGEFLAHRRPVDVACDHGGPACSTQDNGPAKGARPLRRLGLSIKRCLGTLQALAAHALGVLASFWMRSGGTPEDAKFRDTPPTNVLTQ